MSNVPPDFNPYASPSFDPVKTLVVSTVDMARLVKQYRQQMHSLGALWIIIGSLLLILGGVVGFMPGNDNVDNFVMLGIFVVMGLIWLGLGVLTCLKQMWAVYVGLVLSYLMVVNNLINFNLCGLVIMGAAIFQAHRVIGWAKDLTRKGIPLSTRPQDIQTPVNLPPMRF
jgi:hypothetical protein